MVTGLFDMDIVKLKKQKLQNLKKLLFLSGYL